MQYRSLGPKYRIDPIFFPFPVAVLSGIGPLEIRNSDEPYLRSLISIKDLLPGPSEEDEAWRPKSTW
jgi:hypothetical protein